LGDDRLCCVADVFRHSSFHCPGCNLLSVFLCPPHTDLTILSRIPSIYFCSKIIGNSLCFPACRSHFPFALYPPMPPPPHLATNTTNRSSPAIVHYPTRCYFPCLDLLLFCYLCSLFIPPPSDQLVYHIHSNSSLHSFIDLARPGDTLLS